jgi:hypothetical protein
MMAWRNDLAASHQLSGRIGGGGGGGGVGLQFFFNQVADVACLVPHQWCDCRASHQSEAQGYSFHNDSGSLPRFFLKSKNLN